jgi:pSer/pThr/pTyr-binding forkhead associated (FHA) protein
LPANEKVSQMHLVDLAGSERVGDTGATGQRMLEGTNINKSLSVLGKCIGILAEKASGKKKDAVVPYRESNLTRILQNALGGNSKTCMIAAVSPASICYDESLSTLRYADQVKQIKNSAIVNESAQDKLIRELREENDKLKKKLGTGGMVGEGVSNEEIEKLRKAYEEQLEINKIARQEIEKEDERRKKQNASEKPPEIPVIVEDPWKGKFHIANLNEDPFLSGKIRHIVKEGSNVVGKPDKEQQPDIVIGGVGVLKGHCTIVFQEGKAKIIPNADPSAAKVLVNGKLVTQETELAHNDRILFGSHNYFVVNDPAQPEDPNTTWDMANKEAIQDQLKAVTATQDTLMQQKLKELEDKFELEKKKAAEEAQKKLEEQMKLAEEKKLEMQKEFEEKMKQIEEKGGSEEEKKKLQEDMQKNAEENENAIKKVEENAKKEVDEEEKRVKKLKEQQEFKIKNQKELEERLAQTIPKINEVNEMCLQLNRLSYLYSPTIVTEVQEGQLKSKVCIKIFPDHAQAFFNQVDMNDFMEKYYLIQEKFQNFQYDIEHNELGKSEDNTDDDPKIFGIAIKNDWTQIGQAHIYTDSIAHLLDTQNDQTPLIDNKGNINGELRYSIVPKFLENGVEQNLIMFDSIDQLEGKTMKIILKLHSARGLPQKYANELLCKYKWVDEKSEEYQTEVNSSKSINPDFNYEKEHELFISPFIINHIWEGAIAVGVFLFTT